MPGIFRIFQFISTFDQIGRNLFDNFDDANQLLIEFSLNKFSKIWWCLASLESQRELESISKRAYTFQYSISIEK